MASKNKPGLISVLVCMKNNNDHIGTVPIQEGVDWYRTEILAIFITVGAVFFIIARCFLISGVPFQILRAIFRVRSNVTYCCGQ